MGHDRDSLRKRVLAVEGARDREHRERIESIVLSKEKENPSFLKAFMGGKRRGQAFGAFTAIGFVILFLSFLFLLPLINSMGESIITSAPITDPIQQFFIRMFGIFILLAGLFSLVSFAGAWSSGQFGG